MLNDACETLPGIGPTLAAKLAKCGIHTIQDLIFHLPYRYQDRTRITPIQDLRPNDWSVVTGTVCKTEIKFGKRRSLNCYVEDKTGLLKVRFFHFNKQQLAALKQYPTIRLFGEVHLFSNQMEMIHPEYQVLDTTQPLVLEETLTPIYPSTEGLSQMRLRQLIKKALQLNQETLHALEWMHPEELAQHDLPSLALALEALHHPRPDISLLTLESGAYPMLRRLIIEELLAQRLSLFYAKEARNKLCAAPMPKANHFIQAFLEQLPFTLTGAQQRVVEEIQQDLAQTTPMLRLIQGDVGSGKTVVAALAAAQALANGYQVALMAPTEILSEQHAKTLAPWFQALNIPLYRLNGKMKAREKKTTLTALLEPKPCLVVGTHALFQASVAFDRLGLIIIDEQHRFGVEQRLNLQQKGKDEHSPHQLVMTATPIPRTLAMTQFAHFDLSIIDEKPQGRGKIITAVLNQEKRQPIIDRLQTALLDGRQAYWVCTLIDESEKLQCMAATATATQLQAQLPNIRVGLIHGRMSAQDKEATMQAFKMGELQLLVATTVIEVGVDVANANLMIIENAERLGLAQLHQLRGRVGRGKADSHCLLLYQAPLSAISIERLNTMKNTNDGFVIAEKDLALRGSGEFVGTQQTGYQAFKIVKLSRDHIHLPLVQQLAHVLLAERRDVAEAISKRWQKNKEQFLQS